jgi:acyl-CoA synthetase (AMP-forming)/AMP-acid ligase II
MKVALTIVDHLRRAEQVYGDRIAVIDESDQPAESWGSITYAEMARRARAQAAGLDALGIAQGARVAIVSQNSARLLTSFFGVSGYGRVLVPINFRLVAEEVSYIIKHCGAEVLIIDPELEEALAGVTAKHKFIIGAESDAVLYKFDVEPTSWIADEDSTATGKGYRIIEPLCVGVHKDTGNLVLCAWETEGSSFSREKKGNPIPGWRLFRVDKIFTYNILMDRFTEMRPNFNPTGDRRMSRVIKIAQFENE